MKKVYLAGGIDGLTREQATGWRVTASGALRKAGISAIDPTQTLDAKGIHDPHLILYASATNVRKADILLVEIDNPNHGYIGTAIEIYWAWIQRKPIIVWGTANRHSLFLQCYATRFFDTLEEAMAHIIEWEDKHDQRK